jgi:hypothetical protein
MADEDRERVITWEDYPAWLTSKCGGVSLDNEKSRFDVVGAKLCNDVAQSDFWTSFVALRQEFDDEYFTRTGFRLFASMEPLEIQVKPYQSLLDKTYRKNILLNANLPGCPEDGWITPLNWYDSINDLVRTTAVVKYRAPKALGRALFAELRYRLRSPRRRLLRRSLLCTVPSGDSKDQLGDGAR